MTDTTNVSSPQNTAFWIDLAIKHDKVSRKLDAKEAELRAAYSEATNLLDTYFKADEDCWNNHCVRGPSTPGLLFGVIYVLLVFFGMGFMTSLIYMVGTKTYDVFNITLVCSMGLITLGLIIIPMTTYIRLRCRAQAIMASGTIPATETLTNLAQRIYSNPSQTFSERITHRLSGKGKMLIVPRVYPSYERLTKTSTLFVSFFLVYYSSTKKNMPPDDFSEYLTAVILLAILELENAQLIDPAILADTTS